MLALDLLPEFQCDTCTAHQKLSRGCETDAPIPLELDGETLFRCPRRPLLENSSLYADLFWLYQSHKEGHLPESTNLGLLGQPNKLLQMFRVIDGAFADLREEKEEQRRRVEAAKRKAGVA